MINKLKELTTTFTDAYSKTLSKYHGMFVKPVFKLAMQACPYRKDFFAKLGADQTKVAEQLKVWLEALEKIVKIIFDFLHRETMVRDYKEIILEYDDKYDSKL